MSQTGQTSIKAPRGHDLCRTTLRWCYWLWSYCKPDGRVLLQAGRTIDGGAAAGKRPSHLRKNTTSSVYDSIDDLRQRRIDAVRI